MCHHGFQGIGCQTMKTVISEKWKANRVSLLLPLDCLEQVSRRCCSKGEPQRSPVSSFNWGEDAENSERKREARVCSVKWLRWDRKILEIAEGALSTQQRTDHHRHTRKLARQRKEPHKKIRETDSQFLLCLFLPVSLENLSRHR